MVMDNKDDSIRRIETQDHPVVMANLVTETRVDMATKEVMEIKVGMAKDNSQIHMVTEDNSHREEAVAVEISINQTQCLWAIWESCSKTRSLICFVTWEFSQ